VLVGATLPEYGGMVVFIVPLDTLFVGATLPEYGGMVVFNVPLNTL